MSTDALQPAAATAREQVLGRVRQALAVGGPASQEVPWPDVPRVGEDLSGPALLERFVDRVEDYRATVRVVSADELPAAVAQALQARGSVRVVAPPDLDVALPDGVQATHDDGRLTTRDLDTMDAVVTRAATGIAETGTIALDAGVGQGRRALTLVPDHHVCIVRQSDLVETVPEGLERLDPRRPLTLISGPSATSDIELSRVEGVHGPRQLDVLVERSPVNLD